ncbi:MAG TPA: FAD-dependent oxidoreductase, partial [Acidimicrobiales bacterium]|nr:FAD-dependent oxidoreductase [Acidimicrobiales bacterium]
ALPTLNLPADGASLALAVKVFRLGLLDRNDGGDIGWSKVPLAELHGSRSLAALHAAGVAVELGVPVRHLGRGRGGHFEVGSPARSWLADGVVLAVPPPAATGLLAPLLPAGGAAADGPFSQAAARRLGASPIVNIHLVLDRRVTDLPMAAGVDSPVQFVFDRTGPSGLVRGQCLGISLSGAYEYVSIPSDELVPAFLGALGELFPPARKARLVDAVVTRERFATFRAAPGSRRDRPPETTPVAGAFLAGAWCDTGWPATMEGAVRSGASAAAAAHRFFASISPAEAFDPRLEEAHS